MTGYIGIAGWGPAQLAESEQPVMSNLSDTENKVKTIATSTSDPSETNGENSANDVFWKTNKVFADSNRSDIIFILTSV